MVGNATMPVNTAGLHSVSVKNTKQITVSHTIQSHWLAAVISHRQNTTGFASAWWLSSVD